MKETCKSTCCKLCAVRSCGQHCTQTRFRVRKCGEDESTICRAFRRKKEVAK